MNDNREEKTVSIIVPLYHGGQFVNKICQMVSRNVKTLAEDKTIEVELILVNDSPEIQVLIDERYMECLKIIAIENSNNEGIHFSRIHGLNKSQGKYILFLDQDDEIQDNYIQSQLRYIKDADAVLCNGIFRRNQKIYKSLEDQQKNVVKDTYFERCGAMGDISTIISPGQVLIKRESIPIEWTQNVLKKNGNDDCFLWLLMLYQNKKFEINPEILYHHVEDGNNTSMDFEVMADSLKELLSIVEKMNFFEKKYVDKLFLGAGQRLRKYQKYSVITRQWDEFLRKGFKYFRRKNIREISIYGMGVLGKKLEENISSLGIKLCYAIDKRSQAYDEKQFPIFGLDDPLEKVDLVIITPVFISEDILLDIKGKINMPVVLLDDLINDVLKE